MIVLIFNPDQAACTSSILSAKTFIYLLCQSSYYTNQLWFHGWPRSGWVKQVMSERLWWKDVLKDTTLESVLSFGSCGAPIVSLASSAFTERIIIIF